MKIRDDNEGDEADECEPRVEEREDEVLGDEIVSPASYVPPPFPVKLKDDNMWHSGMTGHTTSELSGHEEGQQGDDQDTQYLRRIHIIYTRDGSTLLNLQTESNGQPALPSALPHGANATTSTSNDMPAASANRSIVIENIPLHVSRETMLNIIVCALQLCSPRHLYSPHFQSSLSIPKPFAFNYHFDEHGSFCGRAYAHFPQPADADVAVVTLNDFRVGLCKLRVKYRNIIPIAGKDQPSMQIGKEQGCTQEDDLAYGPSPPVPVESPYQRYQYLPPHAPDRQRPNGLRNPRFIPPLTLFHPINIDLDLPPVTTLPSVQPLPVPMHQRFNRPATTFGGVPLSPMSMRLRFKRPATTFGPRVLPPPVTVPLPQRQSLRQAPGPSPLPKKPISRSWGASLGN